MGKVCKRDGKRYVEIAEQLLADIREGKYAARRSFPSLTQIMQRFGVTRVTAMRSVDELKKRGAVSAAPRSRIVVRKSSVTIGLILPGIAYSEFFPPIMSGISQHCQKEGYGLLFGDVYSQSHKLRAQQAKVLAESFAQKHISGVIFQPIEFMDNSMRINNEIVSILSDAGIPVVLIDYDIALPPERSPFDVVGINNFEAGRRIGEHLIATGAKNIHFFLRYQGAVSVLNRISGVNSVIWAKGGGLKPCNVLHADPNDKEAICRYLKRNRPDAVVCGNDSDAVFLKHIFDDMGWRVPADVMLAGFDDVRCATTISPPLTTIRQPCAEIADMAVRTLKERMAEPSLSPREILLSAPLVVRQSTMRQNCKSGAVRSVVGGTGRTMNEGGVR